MAVKSSKESETLPRGRHSLPRDKVVDSQRARTLEAMLRVVADRGFADTRIADVITEAGISRKTYYELFDDKEDCFLAAYDQAAGRFLEAASRGFRITADGTWMDQIREAFASFLEAMARDPAAARVWTVEVLAAGPRSLANRDAAIRELTQFIDAGRKETRNEIPDIASLAIIGGISELLYTEVLHGAVDQLPTRLPEIVFWIAQPFFGEERANEQREVTVAWQEERNGSSFPKPKPRTKPDEPKAPEPEPESKAEDDVEAKAKDEGEPKGKKAATPAKAARAKPVARRKTTAVKTPTPAKPKRRARPMKPPAKPKS